MKTAAALKHLIQLGMNDIEALQDDGDRLYARDVEWHAPDDDGRNWDMDGYGGPAGYGGEVRLLVNQLRRAYRLGER